MSNTKIQKLAEADNQTWSDEELSGAEFGDQRLKKRLVKIAVQSFKQPLANLNQASEDWADAKAAYRFFDNQKVSALQIYAPHQQRTQARMKQYEQVLVVQDTTDADYSQHPATQGLGPIGTHAPGALGLLLHTSLAFSVKGLPLGVLRQEVWARAFEKKQGTHKERSIVEKESYKWLLGLEETVRCTDSQVTVITLADRESDVYEFLLRAAQLETHYVIRAAQDRCLELEEETGRLWDELSKEPVAGELELEIGPRQGQAKRVARLEVRFAGVTIKAPRRLKTQQLEGWKSISVWAVLVKEEESAEITEPLEWMLLTNYEVKSFEQAVERVKWYQVRFSIEVYHKILKSGCKIEETRLGTAERLKKHLALMSIVAWRLFWMTFLNRENPEAESTTFLAEHEWKALYCRIHRSRELPATKPTVREAVRWIAKLGGFLGRRGDKEPGVMTVWRGWQRLTDIAEDWLIFQEN